MNKRLHVSMRFALLATAMLISSSIVAFGATNMKPIKNNTISEVDGEEIPNDTTVSEDKSKSPKKNLFSSILEYLDDSNKEKSDKKVDFSFLGGPYYSSESKLGIGLVAAAVYRNNPSDSLSVPSNISIYGDISTTLLFSIGFSGNHISHSDGMRLIYNLDFVHFPTKFWGIGYENGSKDANETSYSEFSIRAKVNALFRLADNLYLGPAVDVDHVKASKIEGDSALWQGQPFTNTGVGAGIVINYDTRDNLTAPKKGMLLSVEQKFFPRLFGNGNQSFSLTEFSGNFYFPMWKNSTFAGRLHGRFTYGTPPWSMLSSVGGSYTMRGYYENRYRDRNAVDLTIELRQNIWNRWGIVAWGGVGSVFHGKDFHTNELLPNAGIGLRWEFKKNVNVRLDYGFGKGESGIIFNINEAF